MFMFTFCFDPLAPYDASYTGPLTLKNIIMTLILYFEIISHLISFNLFDYENVGLHRLRIKCSVCNFS